MFRLIVLRGLLRYDLLRLLFHLDVFFCFKHIAFEEAHLQRSHWTREGDVEQTSSAGCDVTWKPRHVSLLLTEDELLDHVCNVACEHALLHDYFKN